MEALWAWRFYLEVLRSIPNKRGQIRYSIEIRKPTTKEAYKTYEQRKYKNIDRIINRYRIPTVYGGKKYSTPIRYGRQESYPKITGYAEPT